MKPDKPLTGMTAVCFESRLSDSATALLEKQGAEVISAPSMQEVPLEEHDEVFNFGKKLFSEEVDVLVCTTGVGTQMLIDTLDTRYELDDILQALTELTIVVRGPKPIRVLKKYEVPFEVTVPEPNTWKELLEAVNAHKLTADLNGQTVAVQEYGETNEELLKGLEQRGAEVLPVRVYRWALPDDTGPLLKGIQSVLNGNVRIALFTSKTQIEHVMRMAEKEGIRERFQEALNNTLVASIGPVCSKGLNAQGIQVDFEPTRPKLGVYIKELSRHVPSLI